jgi:hypothetical protein
MWFIFLCTCHIHNVLVCLAVLLVLKHYATGLLSPRANYTDRATAACRRSNCQLLLIEGYVGAQAGTAEVCYTALFSGFASCCAYYTTTIT